MQKLLLLAALACFFSENASSQAIGDFKSVKPSWQIDRFIFPESTHHFQVLLEAGQPLSTGGLMPARHDFTGFVPVGGSSTNGFLAINAELNPLGDVTILDLHFDTSLKKWLIDASEKVDFDPVDGTRNNCSGGITPWGTVLTCEERRSTTGPANAAGFYKFGYCIEIDPATKTVKNYPGGLPDADKIWKMGLCDHENAAVHPIQQRVVYTGQDNPTGFLFKFISEKTGDLSAGRLFVLKKMGASTGQWLPLKNALPGDVNNTLGQCKKLGATPFNGIEDVEIGPDGRIYFAVKAENRVYCFKDIDLLNGGNTGSISGFQTFVGGKSYQIDTEKGPIMTPWGAGNDNLAFDGDGNLWVLQDGGNNYIWVVGPDHTQAAPNVRIFGTAPAGSEPTGLTFTPDFRFGFMSFQHPAPENEANQTDAFGGKHDWKRDVAIVFSRKEFLGNALPAAVAVASTGAAQPAQKRLELAEIIEFEAEIDENSIELNWITESETRLNHFIIERLTNGKAWETIGTMPAHGTTESESWYSFRDESPWLGTNMYRLRLVDFGGATYLSDVAQAGFFPKKSVIGGRLWPNPASKILQIQLDEAPVGPVDILVFNTSGVKKMEQRVADSSEGRFQIDVEKLRTGHYFIQVRGEKQVFLSGRFAR